MWLLNVKTMKLKGFMANIPRYSILSHCWGHEEVTFQDINSGHFQHLQGYQKLAGCCKLSQREGYEYTWIDTCCIDKSSSAELTEAINSMFAWYERSAVCYTYMEDVWNENPGEPGSLFAKSKWFTRGWTLQELIAPDIVVFLSSNWRELGTRGDLAKTISTITGIDCNLLLPSHRTMSIASLLRNYSIACKMSWAANRQTTRVEDVAYCLMGLFDINMPLLYGEGDKAFTRLQKEIINSSNDFSILAWGNSSSEQSTYVETRGILAPSPNVFETCRDVSPIDHDILSQPTFEVYKSDIRMKVPTIEIGSPKKHLNLLVRQEIGPGSFAPPQNVLTFLKGFTSRDRGYYELFIAILPCTNGAELIGVALRKFRGHSLERCCLVNFQKFFEKTPPKLSTFQVAITHDTNQYIHFLHPRRATIRLAANCLCSQSDNTISMLSNSRSVEEPATFFLLRGIMGSLSIKVIEGHQKFPDFVVVLEYRDLHEVLGNCVALPDTHTKREVVEEAYKTLQSSKDTNEIRATLAGTYEAVVKFRISSSKCLILVSVEEFGLN